jgi:hypothetical protein
MSSQANKNGTALLRPKQDQKKKNIIHKSETKKTRMPVRGGIKIGENED